MLDLFYGVGCCWIKFEFACPQTFSLRQRAPVFFFPHLHPKPLALEHKVFISICELDDLQREDRWSVYRLDLRELNLLTGMRWTMSQHGLNKGFFSFPFSKNNKLRI